MGNHSRISKKVYVYYFSKGTFEYRTTFPSISACARFYETTPSKISTKLNRLYSDDLVMFNDAGVREHINKVEEPQNM